MNYNIYRAEVVEGPTDTDPRITVRILPHLSEIVDVNTLPRWPSFFKTQMVNCTLGSVVWVVCADDFHIGYVLGCSNIFSDESIDYKNQTARMKALSDVALSAGGGLQLISDLIFLYVDDNLIDAVNVASGTKITYHSDGSLFIQGKNGVFIRYGSSTFEVSKEEINMKAKSIRLDGAVSLGTGNMTRYVVTSTSADTNYAMPNGAMFSSTKDVIA